MHYHILPQNFESPMPMLTVIGYSSGRLIAISEEGKLFYMKCDESLFEPGTVLEKDDMLPVSILPDAQKIYESFNIDWRPEHHFLSRCMDYEGIFKRLDFPPVHHDTCCRQHG